MTYVIADSGSTKTEWCVVRENEVGKIYRTGGINPIYQSEEEMVRLLEQEFPERPEQVDRIWFYGAGCAFPEKNKFVAEALYRCFGTAQAEVASDLLGAARALCGSEPGIACILGTGSNSCYYDGEKIGKNVPSLGFILGDEGSGGAIGKRLLGDVLKGILPPEDCRLFFEEIGMSYTELIDRVYCQPLPNRFLAGLTKFIAHHSEHPCISAIVSEAFDEFIRRNLLQYEPVRQLPVSFTGSVACIFRPQLEQQLHKYGLRPGRFASAPMEGLIRYHCERADN